MTQTNRRLFSKPSLILFDLDDTLIRAMPKLGDFVYQQVAAREITIELERKKETERWLLYHWMQPAYIRTDPQVNAPPKQEQKETFWYEHLNLHLRMLGLPSADIESLAQDLLDPISSFQAKKVLAPGVISTLEHLSKSGYRVGLLSNRIGSIQEIAESMGIAGYFELISSGGEIGFLKPDPRFFYTALDQLDASPEQAIYVGDNYYADVVGAQFAGLTPILIDPNDLFSNAGCLRITGVPEILPLLSNAING